MAGKWLEHGLRTLEIHSFSLYFMRESVLVDATTFPQKPDPSKPWQRVSIGEDGSYCYMRCFCRRFWSIPGSHSALINWSQNKPSDTMSYFYIGWCKPSKNWSFMVLPLYWRYLNWRYPHFPQFPQLTHVDPRFLWKIAWRSSCWGWPWTFWRSFEVRDLMGFSSFTGFVATWESDLWVCCHLTRPFWVPFARLYSWEIPDTTEVSSWENNRRCEGIFHCHAWLPEGRWWLK